MVLEGGACDGRAYGPKRGHIVREDLVVVAAEPKALEEGVR